jgi:hypothetical protein
LVGAPETNGKKALLKLASNINLGNGEIWEDLDEDVETKNTLSFEGTSKSDYSTFFIWY